VIHIGPTRPGAGGTLIKDAFTMRTGDSTICRWMSTAVAALGLFVGASTATANSPVFQFPLPDGGQRGTQVPLTLHGQRLTGIEEVVFYEPGITVEGIELVNDSQAKATFVIAPDCRLGEHKLRLRTKSGWTTMQTFYVGPYPTIEEVEPNSDFATPQPVPLNSTVAGVVKREDVEYFAVEAKKGQRISVEVEGIRLGLTPLNQLFDPYIAILDKDRFELAAADDTALWKQDPFVSMIAPEDGTYIVLLRETAFGGNDLSRYRLHIGEFPRPIAVFPLGGAPGETISFRFLGDKTGVIEQTVQLPNDGSDEFALYPVHNGQSTPSPFRVRVAAMPNVMEIEPNDGAAQATFQDSQTPLAFNGVLEKEGDQDWFKFHATQGQSLEFKVFAREYGSPLDAVINVYKGDGTHLGGNDDGGGRPDSLHVQAIPETGAYFVRVRDHLDKGGPDYVYRLEVAPPTPRLTITMPDVARYDDQNRQFVSVPRGNRWMVLMQANRQYFGAPVQFACDDLPPGVTMHAPVMPANVSHIPVIFEAAPEAAIGGKLCDLRAAANGNFAADGILGRWRQNVALVRGDPNGAPYYTTSVDRLAVAVTQEAPFHVRIVEPKVPLLQSGQMNLKIVADRKEGFDEVIHVQLPFRPPGFGAQYQMTIPKGQSEIDYPINAAGNAAVGDWPMALLGYSVIQGGNLFVASPHITIKIAQPLVNGQIAMSVCEQGQEAEVIVQLQHVTPFEGEATLELLGLPPKCTTHPLKIKAGQEQAIFKVTTEKETPVGQHKSLFCQVVLMRDGEEMRQSLAGGGVIRIDAPKPAAVAAAPPPPPVQAPPAPPAGEPKKVLSRLEQLRLEQQGARQ